MERNEMSYEIKLPYDQLCQYLKDKYGVAKVDYFHSPESKSKNPKVSRSKEGLYCHHMDEDKGGNLSDASKASLQPYEWQKKDRLVYCNAIEHLILHIKIAVLRHKTRLKKPLDCMSFFTTGGVFKISEMLNDLYADKGGSREWAQRCYLEIADNFDEYIEILKSLFMYLSYNYYGDKDEPEVLAIGSHLELEEGNAEIIEISENYSRFKVKFETGEVKVCNTDYFSSFTYRDEITNIARMMSSRYIGFYDKTFTGIKNNPITEFIESAAHDWEIDHIGFGFKQYAGISLGDDYGSETADEYISKALPMFSDPSFEISGKPVFWKRDNLPHIPKGAFYIIRFETEFDIKEGCTPSVLYRDRRHDLIRHPFSTYLSDEYNLLYKAPTILSTSKYKNSDGNIIESPVILSLGKNDIPLFENRYNIKYINLLDGCYFAEK